MNSICTFLKKVYLVSDHAKVILTVLAGFQGIAMQLIGLSYFHIICVFYV